MKSLNSFLVFGCVSSFITNLDESAMLGIIFFQAQIIGLATLLECQASD